MATTGRDDFAAEALPLIPDLKRFAKSLTRNDDDAEDLAQETLTKAWQARRSFTLGTNLKAWLFAIMRNHFRSQMRRAWRQLPWDQGSADRISGPEEEQSWVIELKDAAYAIASLSNVQQEALILAGIDGFSTKQAALIARCRPTAMKSRVCRARKELLSKLEGVNNPSGRTGHQPSPRSKFCSVSQSPMA